VSEVFSDLASADGLLLGDSDGVADALAVGVADADADAVDVGDADALAVGDADVVVFGVAVADALGLGLVEAFGVVGAQEAIASEKVVAIANPYNNEFFMIFLFVSDLRIVDTLNITGIYLFFLLS
jgi:hypothetical protein